MTDVAGYCPMGCGPTLFLGRGGHITCSLASCPRRTAVAELLEDQEADHVVVLRKRDFTIRHPLRERLDDHLLTCAIHRRIASLAKPPAKPGTYRLTVLPAGSWMWEELHGG